MPLMQNAIKAVTNRMPKVISPRTHAIIDYATAGAFIGMGIFLWRRNKRAAMASLICGGAEAASSMVTDYPGGVWKLMSFRVHGGIDMGLATLAGSMPEMMNFDESRASRFFTAQSLRIAAVTGLTDFTGTGEPSQFEHLRRAS